MAAAKEINTDAAAVAVLSGPGGIFTVKAEQGKEKQHGKQNGTEGV